MLHVIVDGANVVGSRPDGWWRDRAGAARRLAARLVGALTEDPGSVARASGAHGSGAPLAVHLVLEGAAARARDLPTHPALHVVYASADGDSAIAALAAELAGDDVLVVTADRDLRQRVHRTGATSCGPGALLRALSEDPPAPDRP